MEKKTAATSAPMIAFARLTKVDEEKRLVYGRAAQQVPDRVNEEMDYDGSKPHFAKWSASQMEASLGKSAGNVRGMHGKIAAGILVPEGGIHFNDAEKAVDICSHVTDDQEWKKVLTGTYTGFSIGGRYVSKSAPDSKGVTRYIADPSEISLVDRPAIPTATFFEIQKADGTLVKQEFAKPEEPKVELVRSDGAALNISVEKKMIPTDGKSFEVDGVTYALVKMDGDKATVDVVYEVEGKPEEIGAFAKILGENKLSISDATKMVSDAVIAKRAASAAFADEVNKKYPIDTTDHVKAAWSYINMAKNAQKYSAEDLAKIKGKITAAAKAKGVEISEKVDESEFEKSITERIAALAAADKVDLTKVDDAKRAELRARAALEMEKAEEQYHALGKGFPFGEKGEKGKDDDGDADDAQAAHDAACKRGAKCSTAKADTGDLAKLDGGNLEKMVAEAVVKATAEISAKSNLEKAVLTERIEKLEAQPMPTKVQLALLGTRAVKKGDDANDLGSKVKFEPVRDSYGKVNAVATILKAMHGGPDAIRAAQEYVNTETGMLKDGVV